MKISELLGSFDLFFFDNIYHYLKRHKLSDAQVPTGILHVMEKIENADLISDDDILAIQNDLDLIENIPLYNI